MSGGREHNRSKEHTAERTRHQLFFASKNAYLAPTPSGREASEKKRNGHLWRVLFAHQQHIALSTHISIQMTANPLLVYYRSGPVKMASWVALQGSGGGEKKKHALLKRCNETELESDAQKARVERRHRIHLVLTPYCIVPRELRPRHSKWLFQGHTKLTISISLSFQSRTFLYKKARFSK